MARKGKGSGKGKKGGYGCQRPEINHAAMDAFFRIFGLRRVTP